MEIVYVNTDNVGFSVKNLAEALNIKYYTFCKMLSRYSIKPERATKHAIISCADLGYKLSKQTRYLSLLQFIQIIGLREYDLKTIEITQVLQQITNINNNSAGLVKLELVEHNKIDNVKQRLYTTNTRRYGMSKEKAPMTLLSLTVNDREMLKKLAEHEGATMTECVRRMIQAMFVKTFKKDGTPNDEQ